MKKLIKFLIVISVVFSSVVFVYVYFEKSVFVDNVMLMNFLEELILVFIKEVWVVKVLLVNK